MEIIFQSPPYELSVPAGLSNRGVSIHAPARRATKRQNLSIYPVPGFNPRPRTEGDVRRCLVFQSRSFNPRPRTEGDKNPSVNSVHLSSLFQSTPPHGGRLDLCGHCAFSRMFQSTPPHGGRLLEKHLSKKRGNSVSIHAPARRATSGPSVPHTRRRRLSFNPRPRTEGDFATLSCCKRAKICGASANPVKRPYEA